MQQLLTTREVAGRVVGDAVLCALDAQLLADDTHVRVHLHKECCQQAQGREKLQTRRNTPIPMHLGRIESESGTYRMQDVFEGLLQRRVRGHDLVDHAQLHHLWSSENGARRGRV